jgi:hypothetical protein
LVLFRSGVSNPSVKEPYSADNVSNACLQGEPFPRTELDNPLENFQAGTQCSFRIALMCSRIPDVRDCEWIAQLLECALLRASFVPPKPVRDLRDLTRF